MDLVVKSSFFSPRALTTLVIIQSPFLRTPSTFFLLISVCLDFPKLRLLLSLAQGLFHRQHPSCTGHSMGLSEKGPHATRSECTMLRAHRHGPGVPEPVALPLPLLCPGGHPLLPLRYSTSRRQLRLSWSCCSRMQSDRKKCLPGWCRRRRPSYEKERL